MLIGNALGLVAGYFGGALDSGISRVVDLVYAMPALLVAIVVVGVLGGGYFLAVGLLVVLFSPVDTRIVRGATLDQRSRPYVEAARILGLPSRRIMLRHIWPNVLPLALANAFLTFAFAIVSLSALSFLGLGVGPGTPDWGRMLADSRTLLFDVPLAALAPGIAIVADRGERQRGRRLALRAARRPGTRAVSDARVAARRRRSAAHRGAHRPHRRGRSSAASTSTSQRARRSASSASRAAASRSPHAPSSGCCPPACTRAAASRSADATCST